VVDDTALPLFTIGFFLVLGDGETPGEVSRLLLFSAVKIWFDFSVGFLLLYFFIGLFLDGEIS